SVVVPNRINDGQSLPKVSVLAQGLKLPAYAADGSFIGEQFSSNPAWIVLDMLRRVGWSTAEIDIASFAAAPAYWDESIAALDVYGNETTLARFGCNLVIQKRRSAGDLLRGVRNTSRMMVTYGESGKLQVRVENSLATERNTKPGWSNSEEPLNGGW